MSFCLNMYMCTTYMPRTNRNQNSSGLKLQIVVSHHVKVGGMNPRSSKRAAVSLNF